MSDVLRFLQCKLDSGSLRSTMKVAAKNVAAIASFCSPLGRQSIGRHALVVSFLKEARRLHPPCPPSIPPWDLSRALSQPPFEPLASVDLKEISFKTALLLALISAKHIGDLHAFSVDSDCIRFGPGDCSVILLAEIYAGYMLCRWLVFSEYLRQVLQAGRLVLSLPSAVGE